MTHGWVDAVLILLAVAALATCYALRRVVRRRLLYSRDDDDVPRSGLIQGEQVSGR